MATASKTSLPLLLFSYFLVLTGSPWIQTAEAARPAMRRTVTAIYVFGDSTADVGNNNNLPGNRSKANFLPYGVDFPRGPDPTGRFSNGYNGVDYLAQRLGYDKSPPAVLSVQNSTKQFKRGVSFASGGSGILDITGANVSLSLNTQIKLFEIVTASLTKSLGTKAVKSILSKALFIFSVGNNDMFGYFTKFGQTNSTAKDQFIGLLATTYKAQLQKLYSLGARKFAVVGTTTLGCVPFVRALNPTGGCIEDLNDLSLRYNNATVGLLNALSAELKGMKYSFANSYRVVTDVFDNPLHYGYKELQFSCCGSGRFNASGCIPNSTYCGDRNQYLFWDAVHPTQKTYELVADHAYRGSRQYTVPMNLQQLAKL